MPRGIDFAVQYSTNRCNTGLSGSANPNGRFDL
jgi:hypothetical protein